jgi:hypothetical protein
MGDMSDHEWKPFPVTLADGTVMTGRGRWRIVDGQVETEVRGTLTIGGALDGPPTRAERNSPAYVRAKRTRR